MSLRSAIDLYRIYRSKLPAYLILFITARCNYQCPMCFYWKEAQAAGADELTIEEIAKISRHFGPLLQLSLTGGEPFLRDDVPQICGLFVKNNHVRYVSIPTNASVPEKISSSVERILSAHPDIALRIPLSLDGREDLHDTIRGKGAFARFTETYRALRLLKKAFQNLILDINITYSSYNHGRMEETIDLVERSFEIDNLSITFVRGNSRDPHAKDVPLDDYEKAVRKAMGVKRHPEHRRLSFMIRGLSDRTRLTVLETLKCGKMVVPCLAGQRLIVINEKGDVFPCEISGERIGNVRQAGYDIAAILDSQQARDVIAAIRKRKCFCSFECAASASLAFDPLQLPAIAASGLRRPRGR